MPITREQLARAAENLHSAAEGNHRLNGQADPAMVFLAADGTGELRVWPGGPPPAPVLAAIARRIGAEAIALTCEAWISLPGLSPEAMATLSFDDLPRPADDPSALEVIVTHAVAIGPDGPIALIRTTLINRSVFGTTLSPPTDGHTGNRTDGTTAFLTSLLIPTPDTGAATQAATGQVPGAGPDRPDVVGDEPCPDCHVVPGELHEDLCCIAWCAAVGQQRYGRCNAVNGCRTDPQLDCRTRWEGIYPGFAQCRELRWYAHLTANGWASCEPDTPGAIEDLNRLMTQGTWDRQQGRYAVHGAPGAAAPGARLPDSGDRTGEGS